MGKQKLQVRVESNPDTGRIKVDFIFPDATIPFEGGLPEFRNMVQGEDVWTAVRNHVPEKQAVKMRADFDQMLAEIEREFSEGKS